MRILWFDQNMSSEENQHYCSQMENIAGPEGFFATNCIETCIMLMKSSIKICLITSGSGGLKLIPQIYEFEPIQNVNSAIIFCRDV